MSIANLMAHALAALVTVLGVRYTVFGITVLFNLSSVTDAWILASGDSDFQLDFATFRVLGGLAAALVSALGILSAVYGAGRIMGRDWARRRWMLLTLLALVVHLLRIPIELIAGSLTGWSVFGFALVCSSYAALWILDAGSPSNCAPRRSGSCSPRSEQVQVPGQPRL